MAKDLVDASPARRAYLVLHDYGMGGLWWWILASSAEEITAAFAEVEVIGDPERLAWARTEDLAELDIEDAKRGELASFYETRQRQREDPAFGRLFGKDRVYLRLPDLDGQETEWLTEHGRDGRVLRQVELQEDGTALTSDLEDWPINPPFDLGDPQNLRTAEGPHDAETCATATPRRAGSREGNGRSALPFGMMLGGTG